MEQLDLFAETDERRPLTVADIDEWMAKIRSVNPHVTVHWWPNEWARAGLGALLGEEIPHRRWFTRELLALLGRARKAALAQAGPGETR